MRRTLEKLLCQLASRIGILKTQIQREEVVFDQLIGIEMGRNRRDAKTDCNGQKGLNPFQLFFTPQAELYFSALS
jgi:hypothetical protein